MWANNEKLKEGASAVEKRVRGDNQIPQLQLSRSDPLGISQVPAVGQVFALSGRTLSESGSIIASLRSPKNHKVIIVMKKIAGIECC